MKTTTSQTTPPLPSAPQGVARRLPQKQSLVAQTATLLREEIAADTWPRGLPAERKLCEQYVISRGTLRAALTCLKQEGLLQGAQGKRWKIVRRAPKNSWRPETRRNLVLLTPQPLHLLAPFTIFCIDNLREHLGEAGYHLEVRCERNCYKPQPGRALEEVTQRERPAGWVLNGTTALMQKWFSERGIPCVIMGSRHEGAALPSVDRDLAAACRHAVGAFFARGHSRLVLLNRNSGLAGDLESEKGFCEAAARFQAGNYEALIAHHDGTPQGICTRLNSLLQRRPPPTGFLVAGQKQTLTALGFLIRRGLRLPEDAALIARDDESFMEYIVPSVARYATDPTLFARKVSRAVLRLVQGGNALPRDYRVLPRFVPGETLG